MAKQKTVKTAITDVQHVPANFKAANAPKATAIGTACAELTAIASQGNGDTRFTKLGHLNGPHKGSIVDTVILSGNVNAGIDTFIDALINSGIQKVKNDIAKYGMNDALRAVLAHKVYTHVQWCSNTANTEHGGFGSRLKNVGLLSQHVKLAACLTDLAVFLTASFKGKYAQAYKNRNAIAKQWHEAQARKN